MSVRVMSWVLENSTVSHRGDLLVLLVLADHAHDDGTSAYPGVDRIARKARLSRRGTFEALKRLTSTGAVKREGTGPKGTISYRIVMDQGVQSPHGAATARVQSPARGGAVNSTRGVQSPAPEPSVEPSVEPSLSTPAPARTDGGDEEEMVTFDPHQLPRPRRLT